MSGWWNWLDGLFIPITAGEVHGYHYDYPKDLPFCTQLRLDITPILEHHIYIRLQNFLVNVYQEREVPPIWALVQQGYGVATR